MFHWGCDMPFFIPLYLHVRDQGCQKCFQFYFFVWSFPRGIIVKVHLEFGNLIVNELLESVVYVSKLRLELVKCKDRTISLCYLGNRFVDVPDKLICRSQYLFSADNSFLYYHWKWVPMVTVYIGLLLGKFPRFLCQPCRNWKRDLCCIERYMCI